jgi:hypothetical protein
MKTTRHARLELASKLRRSALKGFTGSGYRLGPAIVQQLLDAANDIMKSVERDDSAFIDRVTQSAYRHTASQR